MTTLSSSASQQIDNGKHGRKIFWSEPFQQISSHRKYRFPGGATVSNFPDLFFNLDQQFSSSFIFIFISRGFFHGLNQLYSFDKNGFQTVFCPRILLDIGMTQEHDVSGRSVFWRRLTETCQNLNVSPRYSPTFLTVHYTGQIISQYCPVRADLMSQTHRNVITGDFQNLNGLDKMV